jgi:outer membrane protein assembly factor BamD
MTGTARAAGLVCAALAATWLAGCAGKPKITPVVPAEELYGKAERQIARKRWDQAAEEFRKLVDAYPYHELSPHAELRLGDMYFLERRYTEAAATFEQFLKLRPSHPMAPYATYLLGSSYYHLRATFDRDPTQTRKAVQVFQRLLDEYASSEYVVPARARLTAARG